MTEVPDRRRGTLEFIISDGWRSYDLLNQLDFGVYGHDVLHQRNFVDPADETIHTQNIENTWQGAKCKLKRAPMYKNKLKRQHGTPRVLFTSYSSEFLWRNKYGNLNVFGGLTNTIRELYVL